MTGYWKLRVYFVVFMVSFNQLNLIVTDRREESNLLKYNVAGECLAMKPKTGRRSAILDKIF